MEKIAQFLNDVESGDRQRAEEILPGAYKELRKLAASKMAAERIDHTLQPTALVHEAYLKLRGPDGKQRQFNDREHFFASAAEAMRRILIDRARSKQSQKRGAEFNRTTWDEGKLEAQEEISSDEILAVNDALDKLEIEKPELATVVKLRYFAGLSIAETASAMSVSESTVDRSWKVARGWLFRELKESQ